MIQVRRIFLIIFGGLLFLAGLHFGGTGGCGAATVGETENAGNPSDEEGGSTEGGVSSGDDEQALDCETPPICLDTGDCHAFWNACANIQALLDPQIEDLICVESECTIVDLPPPPPPAEECVTGPLPPVMCLDGAPQDPGECAGDSQCADRFGAGFGICVGGCCEPYASHSDDMDADHDGFPEVVTGDNCFNPNDYSQLLYNPDQADCDTDGKGDVCDNCPTLYNPKQEDCDLDGVGHACDDDDDNDGIPNATDSCPLFMNLGQDGDSDGIDDVCDNCIGVANADQADSDAIVSPDDYVCGGHLSDLKGDACDNCPNDINFDQRDTDNDGAGDACDADADNDGVANGSDDCPLAANAGQQDADGDGVGDACDNCVNDVNPDQSDCDFNGLGDACDAPCGGGHGK